MSWRKLKCSGNGPAARGGHSAAFFDQGDTHSLVIFGGSDRHGRHFNDVAILQFPPDKSSFKWVLVPPPKAAAASAAAASNSSASAADSAAASATASAAATAPAPRSGHTAVAHRGGMFVFGGQCVHALSEEEQTGEFFADVWRFDLASHTWSQIVTTSPSSSAQPTARNAHAACVVGARMFVTGGSNADGPISDVVVLDLETFVWEEIPARALRKKTHAAVAAQSASSSSDASPIENASASVLASAAAAGDHDDEDEDPDAPFVPEPREMHSATVAPKGASIFVFGGRTAETVCDHFYEFVIGARAWRLHDRCEPLCGHATAMFGQRAVHVGGTDGKQLFDAVQVFNTELLVWTEVRPAGPTPKARFAHSFTAVSAREAVMFGGAGAEADFADVHLLTDGDALSHGLAS